MPAQTVSIAVGIQAVQQNALGLLHRAVWQIFSAACRNKHLLELDALTVHYQEIKIVGSSGGDPSDMAATLKAIADNDIDAGNYVAARWLAG